MTLLAWCKHHRYLMSRLSLQVFFLWCHVLPPAPPFILWWSKLEILFAPLHRSSPFIGGPRCQAIQTENGPYIAERTQKAVYIVRCLWQTLSCYNYSIMQDNMCYLPKSMHQGGVEGGQKDSTSNEFNPFPQVLRCCKTWKEFWNILNILPTFSALHIGNFFPAENFVIL
jgi:hypothetical protein